MEWIKGEPSTAMWCFGTYISNDDPPRKAVVYLWFNPQALPKWWIGTPGKTSPFTRPVIAHMEEPEPWQEEGINDKR